MAAKLMMTLDTTVEAIAGYVDRLNSKGIFPIMVLLLILILWKLQIHKDEKVQLRSPMMDMLWIPMLNNIRRAIFNAIRRWRRIEILFLRRLSRTINRSYLRIIRSGHKRTRELDERVRSLRELSIKVKRAEMRKYCQLTGKKYSKLLLSQEHIW